MQNQPCTCVSTLIVHEEEIRPGSQAFSAPMYISLSTDGALTKSQVYEGKRRGRAASGNRVVCVGTGLCIFQNHLISVTSCDPPRNWKIHIRHEHLLILLPVGYREGFLPILFTAVFPVPRTVPETK